MNIFLNGEPREIAAHTTLAGLLQQLERDARHVAVEVNRHVVPRQRHQDTLLHEGDRLEIVTLVGGG
jgi:thiamine biosynthesis protein ThiS